MRSLTAGLARQAMVAGVMGVLLIAALAASPNTFRRVAANTAGYDRPIQTKAIVIADTPPAPSPQSTKAAASARPMAMGPKPATATHVHLVTASAPHPRPADPAPQVAAAAVVASQPEAERPFDLRRGLFAPVGFVRDNVARLISWP